MRVFLSVLAFWIWGLTPARAACAGLSDGFSATVARVHDAGTLALHDGSELRLAGLLTPHADDARAPAQAWPAAVAAKAEVEALVLGRSITIAFGPERRDRYGRHLGHVTVTEGDGPKWLQGHLLAQGLARVLTRTEDRACEAEMLAAEREARKARRGLWADAAYALRRAEDVDALAALAGSFQVVEGRIMRSRRRGGGLQLDFAREGRFGLVAIVPRGPGPGPGQGLPDLAEGRQVRLRGWLEERGGRPTLDLSVSGMLELLDEGIGDGGAIGYR